MSVSQAHLLDQVVKNYLKRASWASKVSLSEDMLLIIEGLEKSKHLQKSARTQLQKSLEHSLIEILEDIHHLETKYTTDKSLSILKKQLEQTSKAIKKINKSLEKEVLMISALDDSFKDGWFTPNEIPDHDLKISKLSEKEVKELFASSAPKTSSIRESYIEQGKLISETLSKISKIVKEKNITYYQLVGHDPIRASLLFASTLQKFKERFIISARLYPLAEQFSPATNKKYYPFLFEVVNFVSDEISNYLNIKTNDMTFDSEEAVKEMMKSKAWKSLF